MDSFKGPLAGCHNLSRLAGARGLLRLSLAAFAQCSALYLVQDWGSPRLALPLALDGWHFAGASCGFSSRGSLWT